MNGLPTSCSIVSILPRNSSSKSFLVVRECTFRKVYFKAQGLKIHLLNALSLGILLTVDKHQQPKKKYEIAITYLK